MKQNKDNLSLSDFCGNEPSILKRENVEFFGEDNVRKPVITYELLLLKLDDDQMVCPEFAKKIHKQKIDLLNPEFVRPAGKLVDVHSEDDVIGKIVKMEVRSIPNVGLCIIGDCHMYGNYNAMQMKFKSAISYQWVLGRKEGIKKLIGIEYLVGGTDGPDKAYIQGTTRSAIFSNIGESHSNITESMGAQLRAYIEDTDERISSRFGPDAVTGVPLMVGAGVPGIGQQMLRTISRHREDMMGSHVGQSNPLNRTITIPVPDRLEDSEYAHRAFAMRGKLTDFQNPFFSGEETTFDLSCMKASNSWDNDEFINSFDTPHAKKPTSVGTDKNRGQKRKKNKASKKARKNSRK